MSANKMDIATTETKEMLPANLSALGDVSDNFKGLTNLTLPFIKPQWGARLFNMPDETPLKTFEGIILNANPYKVWWKVKLGQGGEKNARPDCLSVGSGGLLQPPQGEDVQSATCASCKWNVFGTGTNEKGEKTKGKRCADRMRYFVMTDSNPLPMQFGIPPTSLWTWSNYVMNVVAPKQLNYKQVVTKFSIVEDPKGHAPGILKLEMVRPITEAEVSGVLSVLEKFQATFGSAPVVEEADEAGSKATEKTVEEVLRQAGV